MFIKPLRLFTCVWGSYLDMFENALVRSLNWPINRHALQGAKWDICTKKEDFESAKEIASKIGIEIELHEVPQEMSGSHPMMGYILLDILKPIIKKNISTGSRMLLAPPDTIFGGDSIANLLVLGEAPDSVVFSAHPRVTTSILQELNKDAGSRSNPRLVNLAWAHLHRSWSEAEYYRDVERTNTHVGGVIWKRLSEDLVSVQHMLPTPYLINWLEIDYEFFSKTAEVYGEIDHLWPGANVVNRGRARVVGSSDQVFIVEITDPDKNVPPLQHFDKSEPDKFWRNALHNQFFKQFNVGFRSEP